MILHSDASGRAVNAFRLGPRGSSPTAARARNATLAARRQWLDMPVLTDICVRGDALCLRPGTGRTVRLASLAPLCRPRVRSQILLL